MSRNLTAGMVTEVTAEKLKPLVLTQFEFDSGNINLWNGIGDISFQSTIFTGAGDLLEISPVEETENIRAAGVNFRLSGIPSAIISIALGEDYQDRPCSMWFAAQSTAGALVADPFLIFKGRMDVMQIDEGGETSSISVSAENRLIDLQRPIERR